MSSARRRASLGVPVVPEVDVEEAEDRAVVARVSREGATCAKLRCVFEYYCSFGERENMDFMSTSSFNKFVRDCGLADQDHLTPGHLDCIFALVQRTHGHGVADATDAATRDRDLRREAPDRAAHGRIGPAPRRHPRGPKARSQPRHPTPHGKRLPELSSGSSMSMSMISQPRL